MLKNLKVENYRGIKSTELKDFSKINLFTGFNGSGKSSILEAIFLNSGGGNPRLVVSMYSFRNESTMTLGAQRVFKNLFLNLDVSKHLSISADVYPIAKSKAKNTRNDKRFLEIEPIFELQTKSARVGKQQRKLAGLQFNFIYKGKTHKTSLGWNIRAKSSKKSSKFEATDVPGLYFNAEDTGPLLDGAFVSPYYRDPWEHVHEQITELVRTKNEYELLDVMNLLDNRVRRILPLIEDGMPVIYIDLGGDKLIPLALMGSGFVHTTLMALGAYASRNGILVIDEIETGLHFSVLPKVFEFLLSVCSKYNIQIFLATHSDEVIKCLAKTAEQKDFTDLSLMKLMNRDGEVSGTKFTLDEIESAKEINAELR